MVNMPADHSPIDEKRMCKLLGLLNTQSLGELVKQICEVCTAG